MADLVERLLGVVGADHVLDDPELRRGFEEDWTGRFRGSALAIVRPGDTAETRATLTACAEERVPVVIQGGNTGLVGGATPIGGEVVVSLTRLRAIESDGAASVIVGAGATLAELQSHVRGSGWEFGVDLGARDGATLGGMAATNAGGARVLRHGTMARQVLGMEAVTIDGALIDRMTAVEKDTAGYNLPQLLCGSEGTLAAITRLRLRLVPRPPRRLTALLALASIEDALATTEQLRGARSVEAVDFLFSDGMELACAHRRLRLPLASAAEVYLLVDCADEDDPAPVLTAAMKDAPVIDAAVADDSAGREALWAYREALPEACAAGGPALKLDVAIPSRRLPAFLSALHQAMDGLPDARAYVFGHLAEGNLHVNVVGQADEPAAAEPLVRLVAEHSGSISAEHGIGQAKARWLGLTRDQTDIELMRAIKRAMDPEGLLNPGKVFP